MSGSALAGVALTMVAGVMSGICMLPMKFARRWHFENVWIIFSIVSLLVLPGSLAFAFVAHLTEAYRRVSLGEVLPPLLFGAGWGIAQVLFGITVRRLGMAVGYAIVVGLGATLGTLVPLFFGSRTALSNSQWTALLAGVLVMVVGIALTAWSGHLRDRAIVGQEHNMPSQRGYGAAVLLAVVCGLMAPMLNYAFAFGQGLAASAVQLGNTPVAAAYAVWPVALLGGLVPNLGYSLYLLHKNRTWEAFRSDRVNVLWAVLMGVLWMGAFALYGMSAVCLGRLGTSIGWGMFQIFMIMTATMSGFLTAEWRSAPRRAAGLLTAGMVGLIGATVLLSMAGR